MELQFITEMKVKMKKMKTKKLDTYKIKDAYTYIKLQKMLGGIGFFREENKEYFVRIPEKYTESLINNNLITKI